jgi:hypothetical protein
MSNRVVILGLSLALTALMPIGRAWADRCEPNQVSLSEQTERARAVLDRFKDCPGIQDFAQLFEPTTAPDRFLSLRCLLTEDLLATPRSCEDAVTYVNVFLTYASR